MLCLMQEHVTFAKALGIEYINIYCLMMAVEKRLEMIITGRAGKV